MSEVLDFSWGLVQTQGSGSQGQTLRSDYMDRFGHSGACDVCR